MTIFASRFLFMTKNIKCHYKFNQIIVNSFVCIIVTIFHDDNAFLHNF
jgi:hypothetical protein